jgi:hypothetical protein
LAAFKFEAPREARKKGSIARKRKRKRKSIFALINVKCATRTARSPDPVSARYSFSPLQGS